MKWGFYYLINILGLLTIHAQSSSTEPFNHSILKLKKSNLVVCLESFQNKISYYEKAASASDCDAKCKEKINRSLATIVSDRDRLNQQLMLAFKKYYHFNPVVFCYEKDLKQFKENNFAGTFFFDDSIQTKRYLQFHPDSVFFLIKTVSPNGGSDSWLFQTSTGVYLENGFPFINENSFRSNWNRLSSSDHLQKNVRRWVKKLNSDLYKLRTKIKVQQDESAHLMEQMDE